MINRRIIYIQRGRQLQRSQKYRTLKFGLITKPRINFEAAVRLSHHRRPPVTKIIWPRIEFGQWEPVTWATVVVNNIKVFWVWVGVWVLDEVTISNFLRDFTKKLDHFTSTDYVLALVNFSGLDNYLIKF